MHANDEFDAGYYYEVPKAACRAAGAGNWVIGRIPGYRFDALVFPAHAKCPDWELGESRISKLWLQRPADRTTVFNRDRGLTSTARTALAAAKIHETVATTPTNRE